MFGKIEDDEMILNDAGIMIKKWWEKLPEKFPDIELDVFQIMPDHFHGIIINTGVGIAGMNPCVQPMQQPPNNNSNNTLQMGLTHGSARTGNAEGETGISTDVEMIFDEHKCSSLFQLIQWFKTMSTNEYIRGVNTLGWPRFNKRLWQRNYYECIIRNEPSQQRIANYIINNPANWNKEKK